MIKWHKVEDKTPPFNKKIVVALGSSITEDACITWRQEISIRSVVMLKTSPNDEESRSEYKSLDSSTYEFNEYQFELKDPADFDPLDDQYSDSIMYWCDFDDIELPS